MCFKVPKRGDATIRGGATIRGNTVLLFLVHVTLCTNICCLGASWEKNVIFAYCESICNFLDLTTNSRSNQFKEKLVMKYEMS